MNTLDDEMMIEQANESDAEEILSLQKLSYKSEAEIYKDQWQRLAYTDSRR